MVTSAVNAVLSEGFADELPFDGDVERAVKTLLPCLEDIFQMPKLRPPRGTPEWLTFMKQHIDECSFKDLVEYRSLADHYWKHVVKKDKRGRPILFNSDMLVWKSYVPEKPKGNTMWSVSSCGIACVLTKQIICPHAKVYVSSSQNQCVLMLKCMCPHVTTLLKAKPCCLLEL